MKLNVGCGTSKYNDFVNIDCSASVNPDVICDLKCNKIPYSDGSADEIWFIHTIEHIEEAYHKNILEDFYRLLNENGRLVIAYPEFIKVAEYYISNHRGNRDFYKHVIYGRQLYQSDYHVSLMDTRYFKKLLEEVGFKSISFMSEPEPNEFNTILTCIKGEPMITREQLLRREVCES